MKKTKIICTMGPNTNNRELLSDLVNNGMDVARFNFSHGDHEEQLGRLQMLQKLRKELKRPVAALLDTKGPEIRLRDFTDGKVELKDGQTFTLTTDEIMGDAKRVSITYKNLPEDVKPASSALPRSRWQQKYEPGCIPSQGSYIFWQAVPDLLFVLSLLYRTPPVFLQRLPASAGCGC